MNFMITLLLTIVVVAAALLVFHYFGPPTYRLSAINVQQLLRKTLADQAQITDWQVFAAYVITQDQELEEIRHCCLLVAEEEMCDRDGLALFSETGKQQLNELLTRVQRIEKNG